MRQSSNLFHSLSHIFTSLIQYFGNSFGGPFFKFCHIPLNLHHTLDIYDIIMEGQQLERNGFDLNPALKMAIMRKVRVDSSILAMYWVILYLHIHTYDIDMPKTYSNELTQAPYGKYKLIVELVFCVRLQWKLSKQCKSAH